MRTRRTSTVALTALLVAAGLSACTAGDTTDPAPTPTPTPTEARSTGIDGTGACLDGVATWAQDDATAEVDDCAFVDIVGSGNDLTVGTVEQLTLEGNDTTVVVGSVQHVTNTGEGNTVWYDGDEPSFDERGSGTTVMPLSAR